MDLRGRLPSKMGVLLPRGAVVGAVAAATVRILMALSVSLMCLSGGLLGWLILLPDFSARFLLFFRCLGSGCLPGLFAWFVCLVCLPGLFAWFVCLVCFPG